MTQPTPTPRIVHLTAVDTSALAEQVVDQAVILARNAGAALHIVHAVDTIPIAAATIGGSPFGVPSAAVLLKAGREHLERLLNRAQQQGVNPAGHLIVGNPRSAVLQIASDIQADLLVVGTSDPGRIERLLLGSVAETLVRKAPCPVLVIRPKRASDPAVPEIEPPCPDCLETQRATNGEQLWCERHSERRIRGRGMVYEYPEGFAMGTLTFRDML